MGMSPPRIQLSIGRLILNGFGADQRDAIVSALTIELQRQLTAPGGIQSLGGSRSMAKLRPTSAAPAHPGPQGVGIRAARQLVGGLRR